MNPADERKSMVAWSRPDIAAEAPVRSSGAPPSSRESTLTPCRSDTLKSRRTPRLSRRGTYTEGWVGRLSVAQRGSPEGRDDRNLPPPPGGSPPRVWVIARSPQSIHPHTISSSSEVPIRPQRPRSGVPSRRKRPFRTLDGPALQNRERQQHKRPAMQCLGEPAWWKCGVALFVAEAEFLVARGVPQPVERAAVEDDAAVVRVGPVGTVLKVELHAHTWSWTSRRSR